MHDTKNNRNSVTIICRQIHGIIMILMINVPLILSGQTKFSDVKDPSSFKLKLSVESKKITTISSNFIQEKNLSVLSEKIISKGHFYFKKEKNLRWEYLQPFSYLIIFRNDKILIQDESKKATLDVNSNKMFGEINRIMIGCVQGTLLADEKNFKSQYFENNTNFLVKVFPLMPGLKELLKEIWIYFSKSDYTVTRLEMHESSGDYTMIDFTDKKVNDPIPDEKFSFN
ncbi:MAG: outer membrane lipoprotein carrier protein LolA [Bacteroidetes bacterium]|nr:outer membrane lipoprotein carrier protein LolA [Bacteroidota bacterium]